MWLLPLIFIVTPETPTSRLETRTEIVRFATLEQCNRAAERIASQGDPAIDRGQLLLIAAPCERAAPAIG